MKVKMVVLDSLRKELPQLNREAFLQQYPGAFLLAMGFLAVEKIMARRLGKLPRQQGRQDATAAVVFGARLRHDAGQSHPLAGIAFFLQPTGVKSTVDIGRNEQCDITVPDLSISDLHCRIEVTEEGVLVVDQGSTNGTTVNLERLEPHQGRLLADEDILTLGRYSFQLLSARTMYDELALLVALKQSE